VLVAQKLLLKMRYGRVIEELMAQFQMSRTSAVRAIQMARELLAQHEVESRPAIRAVVVAQLDDIIAKAREAGKFGDAIRGIREKIKIYGLAAPEITIPMSKEDAKRLGRLTDAQLSALEELDRDLDQVEAGEDAPPTEH
jgi:hypothetical protein